MDFLCDFCGGGCVSVCVDLEWFVCTRVAIGLGWVPKALDEMTCAGMAMVYT